jgi:hypothetical protein
MRSARTFAPVPQLVQPVFQHRHHLHGDRDLDLPGR